MYIIISLKKKKKENNKKKRKKKEKINVINIILALDPTKVMEATLWPLIGLRRQII